MLSAIQLRFCSENFWDGEQMLPLRIAEHPYAVYGPGGKVLNSRWSSPQAAAMTNAWRFGNSGVIVVEDIFGRKAAVELPQAFYDNVPKSQNAIKKQCYQ
jgi:hypothetical protein